MATITNSENFIMIDGTSVAKNSLSISKTVDGVLINGVGIGKISIPLQGTTLDGVDFDTVDELHDALNAVSFRKGGGSGEGAVESVTGTLVGGTPSKPVIDNPLLEFHRVIIPELGTRKITDFKGNIILVTNGVDPASTFTLEWDELTDQTRKITILCTFDASSITHVGLNSTIVDRLPTSAKANDVWEVMYDKFYKTWAVVSVSRVGTDRQVSGYEGEVSAPVTIGVKHLTDIGGFPPFANGVLMATAMDAETQTGLLLFGEFSTTIPKAGTFPTYGVNGVLPAGTATLDGHAVNFGQIKKTITEVNANRTLSKVDATFNRLLVTTGGVALNFTIPPTPTVAWVIGDTISIANVNNANLNIILGAGVNIVSIEDMLSISGKGRAILEYVNVNTWLLSGDLTTT